MAEIMKSHAVKPSTLRHCLPWTLEISAGPFGIVARHDIRAEPIETGQHCQRRSIQNHGLPAGLGVGEKQQATLQVHLLPLEVQDFPKPAAGEQKQPNRRCREGADLGEAVLGLWQMLGAGRCLAHVPGKALGLCLADGRALTHQLLTGEEPLAAMLFELFDPADRIHPLGHDAAAAREGIHAANDC